MESGGGYNVDFLNCNKGLWLVKVPKYIADGWNQGEKVGTIIIDKTKKFHDKGNEPDITFISNNGHLNNQSAKQKVLMKSTLPNSMYIASFADNVNKFTDNNPNAFYFIEGKVNHRLELRPPENQAYLNLKKIRSIEKAQPINVAQKLDRHVLSYKPVSAHNLQFGKGGIGAKNSVASNDITASLKKVRLDKERLMEVLFQAFEKHQYYSLKDLVHISEQPVSYLKEILKDICNYNTKNPCKNMWELKPEYRHYHNEENSVTT